MQTRIEDGEKEKAKFATVLERKESEMEEWREGEKRNQGRK